MLGFIWKEEITWTRVAASKVSQVVRIEILAFEKSRWLESNKIQIWALESLRFSYDSATFAWKNIFWSVFMELLLPRVWIDQLLCSVNVRYLMLEKVMT